VLTVYLQDCRHSLIVGLQLSQQQNFSWRCFHLKWSDITCCNIAHSYTHSPLGIFLPIFLLYPLDFPVFANHFVPQMLLLLLLLLPVSSVNIDLKSIHLPLRQCLIFYGPSAQLEVFISRQNFSANFPLPPLAYKTFPKFRITWKRKGNALKCSEN